jgi:uncharacterized membrane protein YeaQ/YmgE (transglycosylase-associated protein family)
MTPGLGGWLGAIIIGAIAGWLAEQIMKSQMGLLMNIVIGIVGAIVGNLIASLIPGVAGTTGFSIWSLVIATLGAVVLLWIVGMVRGGSRARV